MDYGKIDCNNSFPYCSESQGYWYLNLTDANGKYVDTFPNEYEERKTSKIDLFLHTMIHKSALISVTWNKIPWR